MRQMTPEEKSVEVGFMQVNAAWPMYPLLPVKKRKPNGGFPDCAVMTALTGFDVLLVSIDALLKNPTLFHTANREKFESAAAAVEAGWVVD